jgi:hypothetical protein
VPADRDPLAGRPPDDAVADSVEDARDFVARDARVRNAGKRSRDREGVAVADATRFDPYPDRSGAGLRNVALDELEWSVRMRDLDCTHL